MESDKGKMNRRMWDGMQLSMTQKFTPKERFGPVPSSTYVETRRLGSPQLRGMSFRENMSNKVRKELLRVQEHERELRSRGQFPPLASPRNILKSAHSLSPRNGLISARALPTEISITSYHSSTQVGTIRGQSKPHNQDSLLICQLDIVARPHLFLVCDGHGESGHLVSSFITRFLPCYLLEEMEGHREPSLPEAMKQAFEQTNQALKDGEIDAFNSGSTCVSVIISRNRLICGNVGDSRAILGRWTSQGVGFIALSEDHKPDLPMERARIQAAGGRVAALSRLPTSCTRVWFSDSDCPGLSMSRALGDLRASSIGIIPTPDITSKPLSPEDLFIILASDGVWEFISNQEAVELVYSVRSEGNSSQSAQKLVDMATTRWREHSSRCDDITAVVVFLG